MLTKAEEQGTKVFTSFRKDQTGTTGTTVSNIASGLLTGNLWVPVSSSLSFLSRTRTTFS